MSFILQHLNTIGVAAAAVVLLLVLVGIFQNRRSQREMRLPTGQPRGHAREAREAPEALVFIPQGRHDRDERRLDAAPLDPPAARDHGQGHDWKAEYGRRPAAPGAAPRPAHLSPPRPAAGDADTGAELAQLAEQLSTLEERLTSGLRGLTRRLEQLEGRMDGGSGTQSEIVEELDDAFAASGRAGAAFDTGGAAAVVSQPISFGPGGDGEVTTAGVRVPVELNGTEVALSATIPPDAWLTPQGGGRAAVSLNPEVQHNRFALDRFATFFDLGDRREGAYTTRTPAEVRWDEHDQRGVLLSPGKAVAR